jgi:ABC-type phosphate/phosphonate transport system substrate-binding protein
MNKIASLPMYDWPELRPLTEQWWQVLSQKFVAEGLVQVPVALNGHKDPHEDWHHPRLLMSQTCGYPLRHEFCEALEIIAVPRYTAEGCEGPYYSSMVVARKDDRHLSLGDFSGRRAAYNSEDSQSGYSSLRAVIAPLAKGKRFFSNTVKTGAHLKSLAAVVANRADICATDCVGWGLAKRLFPELVASLCVICQTPLAPALPYVTVKSCSNEDLQSLRWGLLKSVEDKKHKDLRAHLLIDGFDILPPSAYERIDEIEKAAIDAGYPMLA